MTTAGKHLSVYMLDARGRELGGFVTQATSLFAAVREAWAFFRDPHWQGATPTRETLFRVREFNTAQVWFVRAAKALDAVDAAGQLPLLDTRRSALDPH